MVESETFESEGVGGIGCVKPGFDGDFNEEGCGESSTGAESRL